VGAERGGAPQGAELEKPSQQYKIRGVRLVWGGEGEGEGRLGEDIEKIFNKNPDIIT
jgi:hypothetical protein